MKSFDHGSITIELISLMESRGLSKNQLEKMASMQRTQLNRYCNNDVNLVDLDVLARLCHALDCTGGDILVYHPSNQAKEVSI